MIGDLIVIFITFVFNFIQQAFGALNYIIPSQIINSFNTFFSYARIGDGIFPMSDILLAIGSVLTVWILMYVVKLILFVFSLIPIFGKVVNLPQHSMTTTQSTSQISNEPGWSQGGMRETRTQTKRSSR